MRFLQSALVFAACTALFGSLAEAQIIRAVDEPGNAGNQQEQIPEKPIFIDTNVKLVSGQFGADEPIMPPILSPGEANPVRSSGMLAPMAEQPARDPWLPPIVGAKNGDTQNPTAQAYDFPRQQSEAPIPVRIGPPRMAQQSSYVQTEPTPALKPIRFDQRPDDRLAQIQQGGGNAGYLRSVSSTPMNRAGTPVSPPVVGGWTGRAFPLGSNFQEDEYSPPEPTSNLLAPNHFVSEPSPLSYEQTDGFVDGAIIGETPVYGSSVIGTCASCGNAGCNGSCGAGTSDCQTCGPGGCYNASDVAARFGCSGSVSCATRYFSAEALFWKLDNTSISGANAGGLGDFDAELGWRLTMGRRFDATAGEEISYMGGIGWRDRRITVDPGFRLSANFNIGVPFSVGQVGAFFNAGQQNESRSADMHSFEYNRVKWGWDVVKTHWGIRGIYFEDDYRLFSRNLTAGAFDIGTRNYLFGPQIGGELFYDVGFRTSYSFVAKAGAYVNVNEMKMNLTSGGVGVINRDVNDANISSSLELGVLGHHQLTPNARLKFGYNLLWMFGLATTADNFPTVLNSNTGGSVNDEDDLLFHGFSAGIEIFR